ncbi:ABC transporter ATP-binding protein [Pseudomonas sp. URMO17WK12:I12]|uniref:ABC transporter ATP-binding protein n=1 Tax=Pseudomonas sp. URMO17WK12:I12 TaxID=1259797 RepID=UPI00047F678A|nr:ABC transporter ATP-binding protein [Pseudomonas sp. URMO17WK12:I12]
MNPPLLEIRNLVKRFGGLVATNGANLSVHKGEVHALIGPNGAGKTTLIHQISGALESDEGTMVFDGVNILGMSMHKRVAAGLARSYQITSIFKKLTVLDNVALAVQARSGSSFRFWRAAISEAAIFNEANEILEQVGLGSKARVIAGSLAHGEQRQLELGITLGTRPKLLLLDEPMAGMGPEDSEKMVELLSALKGQSTVLLIEHDMAAVFRLADRMSALVYGQVIASGIPCEVRANPEVKRAYLGEETV